MSKTINITPDERKVLRALRDAWDSYGDYGYQCFRPICRRTKLTRNQVRRCCRSLKRKGLAEYARGLWTEDGKVAGSGYACTKDSAEALVA